MKKLVKSHISSMIAILLSIQCHPMVSVLLVQEWTVIQMEMIDGNKLRKHLDYLIERDNQFAKMCDGDDDYSRQRKYCFEVDALAYQLCKSVMNYYLVKDIQPVDRWIDAQKNPPPIIDRRSMTSESVLILRDNGRCSVAYYCNSAEDGDYWTTDDDKTMYCWEEVAYWQPLPELPKRGGVKMTIDEPIRSNTATSDFEKFKNFFELMGVKYEIPADNLIYLSGFEVNSSQLIVIKFYEDGGFQEFCPYPEAFTHTECLM